MTIMQIPQTETLGAESTPTYRASMIVISRGEIIADEPMLMWGIWHFDDDLTDEERRVLFGNLESIADGPKTTFSSPEQLLTHLHSLRKPK